MNEEWQGITDFPDYAVSNMGRLKRITEGFNTKAGLIMSQSPNEKGYLMVSLPDGNGKRRTRKVHLLVLAAFIGPRPPGKEGNHQDKIKSNNRADNLEWITHAENMHHSHRHGHRFLRGEESRLSLLKDEQVYEIKNLLGKGDLTLREIGEQYGVKKGTIHAIKAGRNWAHIAYP